MVAARLLVLKGLFVQARTLVRSFAESADLTSAIMLNEKILLAFIDPAEDLDAIYKTWRQVLAPARLREVIEGFWKEMEMPEDLLTELGLFAKHDQRWLSLAAHGYRVALAVGGAAHDSTRVLRDDVDVEFLFTVQGGSATLSKLVDLSAHFLQLFLRIRLDRFSWQGNRHDADQRWTYVRGMLVRDLWLTHLTGDDDDDLDADGEIPDEE
jgi:hypothetical protein